MQGDRQCEIARMREKFIVESSGKSHVITILYFNRFQCKGWVSGHRSMECRLSFIRKYSVILEFHLTALLQRASNMRLQSKMTSVVLPSSS